MCTLRGIYSIEIYPLTFQSKGIGDLRPFDVTARQKQTTRFPPDFRPPAPALGKSLRKCLKCGEWKELSEEGFLSVCITLQPAISSFFWGGTWLSGPTVGSCFGGRETNGGWRAADPSASVISARLRDGSPPSSTSPPLGNLPKTSVSLLFSFGSYFLPQGSHLSFLRENNRPFQERKKKKRVSSILFWEFVQLHFIATCSRPSFLSPLLETFCAR